MKRLISITLLLFAFFGIYTPARANTVEWIQDVCETCSQSYAVQLVSIVHQASIKYDVDPSLLLRIIRIESSFNPKAVGGSNSTGLMQIIPKYHKKRIKGRNLFNPSVNVDVGAAFLAEKLDDCDGNARCALMKYNASYRKKKYASDVLRVRIGS